MCDRRVAVSRTLGRVSLGAPSRNRVVNRGETDYTEVG